MMCLLKTAVRAMTSLLNPADMTRDIIPENEYDASRIEQEESVVVILGVWEKVNAWGWGKFVRDGSSGFT